MIDKNLNPTDVVNTDSENQENTVVVESTDASKPTHMVETVEASSKLEENSEIEVANTDSQNETEEATPSNNETSEAEKLAAELSEKQRLIHERLAAIKKEAQSKNIDDLLEKPEEKNESKTTEDAHSTDETLSEIHEIILDDTADEYGYEEHDGEIVENLEFDYSQHSKEELLVEMRTLFSEPSIINKKEQIEIIKTSFYKKHSAENAKKRKEFLEQGGDLTAYKVEPDPLEIELKEFYKNFKDLKAKHNEEIEKQKQVNLEKKFAIIAEIEKLTGNSDNTDSLNKTFQDFKDLQQKWREVGPVPQQEIKNLWENYNYQIEKFYDYIKINKELRDLDLRKNLEQKMYLCEKAEELIIESNILKAFRELQKFHGQWRDIGPVPNEKREEIWERFKEATNKINKKHQDYFDIRKEEEKNNLKAKILLCEKAEELSTAEINAHKDWEDRSKEVVELQKIWKLIGFVPKKESNKIYDRFREACDEFFNKKRDFYSKTKSEQETNLQQKTELCIQAEALSDSTEWKKTTEEYIKIQNDWKTIGPVARRHSDAIWKRFRSACNKFFERKANHFANIDSEQDKNLQLKLELIEKVKAYQTADVAEDNLKALKDFQKEWTEIGHVPIKNKDEIQKVFREAINSQFEKLNTDDRKRNELKFANKLKSIQGTPKAQSKMRFEREKLVSQLERIRQDIQLWENNIGFFTKSKNAESLIKDVKRKISDAKREEASIMERIDLMEKYSDQ